MQNLKDLLDSATQAVILRHHKERLSKCSVEPLVGDPRFQFLRWTPNLSFEADGFILLEIDAPLLSEADSGKPLLLLDSTWRYLPAMRNSISGQVLSRSLPANLATAYMRTSKLEPDPTFGLASVEALYASLRILQARDDSLLADYHWRQEFLDHCHAAKLPE